MQQPTLSVIIPVCNRSTYLREAIISAMEQEVGQIEVLVVDDGSDRDCAQQIRRICEETGARLIVNERNLGVSASRNIGIRESTGTYLVFLDDDDLMAPGFVKVALASMDDEVQVVIGRTQLISGISTRRFKKVKAYYNYLQDKYHHRPVDEFGYFLIYCPAIHCVVWRRSCFDQFEFDETISYGEDRELFLRLRKSGVSMKSVQHLGGFYRILPKTRPKNRVRFIDVLLRDGLVAGAKERSYCHLLKGYFLCGDGRFGAGMLEIASSLTSPSILMQQLVLFFRFRLFR